MTVLRQGGLFGAFPTRCASGASYSPRAGDIVLRLLAAPGSLGLASLSLSGYSHCGVVNRVGGQTVVADCYPACGDHDGGLRQSAWMQWISREGAVPVLHWLALRPADLDPDKACQTLDRLLTNQSGFTLITDRVADLGDRTTTPINCSAFVKAFLEDQGVDCTPGQALTPMAWHLVRRFLSLARQGFYNRFPGCAGHDYYALAKRYGLTAVTHCPLSTLQPGFCELLPQLEPVAYGQNPAVPAATRVLALYLYRRLIPDVRAALACHGLTPRKAKRWLARNLRCRLGRLVARLPQEAPVHGTRLAIALLLDLTATPMPYLTIPLAAQGAFHHGGALRPWFWRPLLLAAPILADLAAQVGIKPFNRLTSRKIKV